MVSKNIAAILKQQRNLHQFTPDQVVSELNNRGISISAKALYAYESGTNLPKVPVFLALCDIYNIRDIMNSFGYNASLCIGDNDWESDQYEDFFKVSLYEKIYLLAKWGIPSFDGYEALMTQPAQLVLSDEELRFIHKFRRLDERGQTAVLNMLDAESSAFSGDNAAPAPKEA